MKHFLIIIAAIAFPTSTFAQSESDCIAIGDDVQTITEAHVAAILKGEKPPTRSETRNLVKSKLITEGSSSSDFLFDNILMEVSVVSYEIAEMDNITQSLSINHVASEMKRLCTNGDLN